MSEYNVYHTVYDSETAILLEHIHGIYGAAIATANNDAVVQFLKNEMAQIEKVIAEVNRR